MNGSGTRRRQVIAFLNPQAGMGRAEPVADRLRAHCDAAGLELRLTVSREVHDLQAAVEAAQAVQADTVVVGGGDGTLSHAAVQLLERDIALGILPLGTFNHFAKDAGIPLELDAAMAVAVGGAVERFDVGELNGRIFLNTSSLGLYPLIVRLRAQHPVRGPAKWVMAAWHTLREMRRPREIVVQLEIEGKLSVHRTPIVMVGNNPYKAFGLEAASRPSLTDGVLAIYIVKAGARRHLLRLVWRILRGRVRSGELEVLQTKAATLEPGSPGSQLQVANDGEVTLFASPLDYRIRPGALRVRVPPASAP